METEKDELFAFPYAVKLSDEHVMYENGMSLRDYFAAAALTGMFSNHESFGIYDDHRICEFAWKAADYMMELRDAGERP